MYKETQITVDRFSKEFNDIDGINTPQKYGVKPLFKVNTDDIQLTEFEKVYCKISGVATFLDVFGIPIDEILLPLDLVLGNITSWRKVARYIHNGEIVDKALPSIAIIVVKEGIENIFNIVLPNSNTIIDALLEECALTPDLLIELIISTFSLFSCIRKGMPREDALGFVVKESDEKFINFFKLLLNYIPEKNTRDIADTNYNLVEEDNYYPITNLGLWAEYFNRQQITIVKTGIELNVNAIRFEVDNLSFLRMYLATQTGAIFSNEYLTKLLKEQNSLNGKQSLFLNDGIIYSPITSIYGLFNYTNIEIYPFIGEKDYKINTTLGGTYITKIESTQGVRTSGNCLFSSEPFKVYRSDGGIDNAYMTFSYNNKNYYYVSIFGKQSIQGNNGLLLPIEISILPYNDRPFKVEEINTTIFRTDITKSYLKHLTNNKITMPLVGMVEGKSQYINTYQLVKDNLDNDIDEIFYWLKLVIRDTENGKDSYDNYLTDEDTPNPLPTPDIPTPQPPITPPPETQPSEDNDKDKGGGFIIPPITIPNGNIEIPDIPSPNIGNIPNIVLPNIGRGNAVYEMNYAKLKEFNDKMYSNNILQKIADFKFNIFGNPVDYLISLHEIYIDPLNDADNEIYLGFYGLDIQAPVISQRYQKLNCGKIDLTNYGKDYYKYAPYTTLKIYLPFIGIVDININDFADGFIECEYVIDVYTGVCVCTLYSIKDNKLFKNQYTANCIAQLPVSYTSESFTSNMIKGAISGGISGGGVGAGIGALSGALSGGVNISSTGHLEGSAGAMSYKKPFIIITMPEYKDIENKSIFRGVPVYTTKKIGEVKGFCKCIDIRLQSSCNLNEYNQIINLLKEGVIV